MTAPADTPLTELHAAFRAGSTRSMPIAGMICWAALGLAALRIAPRMAGTLALYIMAGILPLAFVLDRLKGRNIFAADSDPLTRLFLTSIAGIAVTVPVILIGARGAADPTIVALVGEAYRASAISFWVVVCYVYSLVFMRKVGS